MSDLSIQRSYVSMGLAVAILAGWCLAAALLDQPLLATQRSAQLLTLGAVDGHVFETREWWRLWISQFLHVHFLHMGFNAGCVLFVGHLLERSIGRSAVLLGYLIGGAVGQLASVVASPLSVSSGASQALMALCGAAAVLVKDKRASYAVLTIVAIQVALDLYAASTIKSGHSAGFLSGLLLGGCMLGVVRLMRRARRD